MICHRIVIIGGGPAGLAAAVAAWESGIEDILILERDSVLGGILNQCIHNGFGLHTFKEELTGPEYAHRYIQLIEKYKIPYQLDTMVIEIGQNRKITAISRAYGLQSIQADSIVLAMGCRERPRGALNIPGFRPAGIFTAGTAQRLVNIEGRKIGREIVILGSGDIGLIMARRMTLEGANVKVAVELMPYSGGLKRNIVQCLEDYDIPLKLSHTVTAIEGKERITGVRIARVSQDRKPVPGTEEYFSCDTLLLSCGLIPENELTRSMGANMDPVTSGPAVDEQLSTSVKGVFACGNVLHVHDLVDYVTEEASRAGIFAAKYVRGESMRESVLVPVVPSYGVRYTVPQAIHLGDTQENLTIRFRVDNVYQDRDICAYYGGRLLARLRKKVMTPGEMEQIVIKSGDLLQQPQTAKLKICTEGRFEG